MYHLHTRFQTHVLYKNTIREKINYLEKNFTHIEISTLG